MRSSGKSELAFIEPVLKTGWLLAGVACCLTSLFDLGLLSARKVLVNVVVMIQLGRGRILSEPAESGSSYSVGGHFQGTQLLYTVGFF